MQSYWYKRKSNEPLAWKNYGGRKVFTINVSDVEHVEFEHFPKKWIKSF